MGRVVLGRVCRGVWGVSGGGLWGEKVSLAPLYYPDTLVNLDTCLGVWQEIVICWQEVL